MVACHRRLIRARYGDQEGMWSARNDGKQIRQAMSIPGIPLSEHLPAPSDHTAVVLVGGDDVIAAELGRAGYRVERHHLDTGPLAQLAGLPFTPPVVAWPFPDEAFAAVILLDELALTVREEEALAEAARVLRPGGVLLLRVPGAGPLAWLDGYNGYRYVRDISKRGRPLPAMSGVGWRRHYGPDDLRALLGSHFRIRDLRGVGLGLTEATRLGLHLAWRWALRSEQQDDTIREVTERVARWEGRASLAGRGYWLAAAAERRA
jgi:SAM-dependent methyltransferase